MIIHEQVELDYDDVLLLPHRSKHASRKEVDVTRSFKFYHSPRVWSGMPIFCSNMGTTGTIQMGLSLSSLGLCTALHKFIPIKDLVELYSDHLIEKIDKYCWYTAGIRSEDKQKLEELVQTIGRVPNLVIDVPNGYTDDFVNTCASFRSNYPEAIIMAGNVVTGPMVQELILHGGVDIVKVGIGGGCFVAGTKVQTNKGKINIERIRPGDTVLTHKNQYKKVISTLSRKENKRLFHINNIICTPNHEFYVIEKSKIINNIDDTFIEKHAIWISAEELNDDYLLIQAES